MKFQVVADSSSDLMQNSYSEGEIGFSVVPLSININDTEYVDTDDVDVAKMLSHLRSHKGPSTSSCPSPESWAQIFRRADCTFAVCMTAALSGTYNCAMQARDIVLSETPEKKIFVFDTQATAGLMILVVEKIFTLIKKSLSVEAIDREIKSYMSTLTLLFSLASFDTLVKNGRMSRIAGVAATALGIRAVARAQDGVIKVIEKPRGETKALQRMVELMATMKPNIGEYINMPVIINHCNNLEGANKMKELIQRTYKNVGEVRLMATKGLCSFYACVGGILLAF